MAFRSTCIHVISCFVAMFLAGSLIAFTAAKKRGRDIDCDLLDENYDADCFEIIDFEDASEAGFISVESDIIYRIPDGYFGLKWNVDQTTLVLNVSKPFVQSLSPNIVNHLDILGSFILFNGNSMTVTIGEIGDGTAFQIKSFDALGNWENEEENELICFGYLNYREVLNISLILNYEEAIHVNFSGSDLEAIEQFVCNTSIDVLGQVVLDNFEVRIGNITDIAQEESSSSSSSSSSKSSSSSGSGSSSSGGHNNQGSSSSSKSGSKSGSSNNYGSNSGSNSGGSSHKSSSGKSSSSNSGRNSGSKSTSNSASESG